MNPWARIYDVFAKEASDNLRDRRSVASALMTTLIGPVMLLILIFVIGRTINQDYSENPLKLHLSGADQAPGLVQFLDQNGVDLQPAPASPEEDVRKGDVDVVLIIPDNYEEDFSAGRPATVRIVVDTSRQTATASIEQVKRLLNGYSDQIGRLRLLARGINPEVTEPLAIEEQDVATPQSQGVLFLNILPYFIVMVVFMGGMYVIIDATAGERERGSLEPLLINPVARWEFVIGKMAAAVPFAIIAVITTLAAFAVVFNVFPLEDYVGVPVNVDPGALIGIFLITLPMILLASALQMIIATYTRSFKEAQTYVGFLPLIPALPGIGLAFLPIKASIWTMLIPTFGQQLLINQLMRGEPLDPIHVFVSTAATLFLAFVLVWIAIRLYERERILLGGR